MAGNETLSVTERVRWWLVALFVGAGLLCIFIAYLLTSPSFNTNTSAAFWSSVLVNVGSTLLLAALLVWFERRLVARVEQSNARVAETAGRVAEASAREAVAAVEKRLDALEELDRAFSSESGQIQREQEEQLARVASDVTFDSIEGAMIQTQSLGGIRSSQGWETSCSITIAAGDGPTPPRVLVTYRPETINDERRIEFETRGREGLASVTWRSRDSILEVLKEFRSSLVRVGLPSEAHSFSPAVLFSNLQGALRIATERREGRSVDWKDGAAIVEWVAPDILLSEAGLEVRKLGVVMPAADFPLLAPDGEVYYKEDPDRPASVTESEWAVALNRAHTLFDRTDDANEPWSSGETPF